jgi:hypothetical protein
MVRTGNGLMNPFGILFRRRCKKMEVTLLRPSTVIGCFCLGSLTSEKVALRVQ